MVDDLLGLSELKERYKEVSKQAVPPGAI
jgi:hypothetical protein